MIALTCDVFGFLRSDVIIIGEIMLLIPGLAMTNSIRDMFSGDTLSGLLRFVESLLWTAAMVLGFMVSMILCGSDVRTDIEIMPYWFKMLCVIPCSIGFLIYYNSRKRLMTFGLLGALLSFGAFVLAFEFPFASSDFLPAFFCGLVAAIYSEVLSKRLHVPSAVFFVTCILPIIPGRYLFTAMNYFVHGNLELAGNYGYLTLEYSIAIAIAICLVWTISRTWRNMHLTHHMVKIVRPLDHA